MPSYKLLPCLVLCAACGAPSGGAAGATSAQDISSGPLRLLTGDHATINADWTAGEGRFTFPVVRDGTPSKPSIAPDAHGGASAIAFTVPTDTSGHKERVEYKIAQASDADGLHFDNDRYSGFAFKLGAGAAPFQSSAIFFQAWQGFPWGPPVSLKVEAGAGPAFPIRLAVRDMSVGPDSTNPDITLWRGSIDADVWHTFIVHLEPRHDGPGRVELWMDGAEVLDWTGPFGYDPATVKGAYDGLDVKNGIYQPSVNQGHTFYFDQMVFASTYAAAASALGSPPR